MGGVVDLQEDKSVLQHILFVTSENACCAPCMQMIETASSYEDVVSTYASKRSTDDENIEQSVQYSSRGPQPRRSATLKRSLPLDPAEALTSGLPIDDPDLFYLHSKKMLTAAALGAGSSISTGTTPSSLCSTPVTLFGSNHLLPYAASAAATPQMYQQLQLQQQVAAGQAVGAGSAYEGIPIFIVPQNGATSVPLASLQRAAEIKATLMANSLAEPKVDTSKHSHIFVGDLSPEVDNRMLKDAFAPYGEVSEAKVIRDSQTQKSKGYGFVSFPQKENAEKAMTAMNGQWVGRRAIRTNWATRRPSDENKNTLTFEQVFNSTKPENTSVYVGNISQATTEQDLRVAFIEFGEINEVRLFKAQGYAFVRFEKKECATKAIMEMNGKDVAGNFVRCSWGRTQQTSQAAAATPLLTDLSPLLTTPMLQQQIAALPNPYIGYYPQYQYPTLMPQWQV